VPCDRRLSFEPRSAPFLHSFSLGKRGSVRGACGTCAHEPFRGDHASDDRSSLRSHARARTLKGSGHRAAIGALSSTVKAWRARVNLRCRAALSSLAEGSQRGTREGVHLTAAVSGSRSLAGVSLTRAGQSINHHRRSRSRDRRRWARGNHRRRANVARPRRRAQHACRGGARAR
jgi:hypothetical protein